MTRPSVFRLSLRPDVWAALAVALAPVLYFLPAVRGEIVLSPDDGFLFNVPLRVIAAQIVLEGSVPLWNPYIFSGMPLLASAQGGLLFPLNWFYLAFTPIAATNMMVVTSYMLAALGAYLYARRSGSSITGAILTSLVWQWGGFMIAQISHINIVQTAAMLPWTLWAVDGYGEGRGRKWGVLLAALIALQSFVGHQQTFAYSLMLVGVYAAVMAFARERKRALYLWSLVFLVAGVFLSAVQILPTFELLRNSPRATASYAFFTAFSMPRRSMMSFVAPYLMGGGDGELFRAAYVGPAFYSEYVAYIGLLTLMLAIFAVAWRRDARNAFWAAAAVVCLTLALGDNAPLRLYKLIYHVPVLNLFRVPARHLMEAEFALAVLAGRGLTALCEVRGQRRALRLAGAIGASIFLMTLVVVTLGRPADFKLGRVAQVSLMRAPELFMPVLIAALSAWALWVYARGRRKSAGLLIIAVLALDLAMWGQFTGWRISGPKPGEEFWQTPEAVNVLRGFEAKDPTRYRILTAPHSFDPAVAPVGPSVSRLTDWVLWTQPDVYMMHGIENAAGYDGFGFARYEKLAGGMTVWGELSDPDATLRGPSREIDLLNVRYLLSMRRKGGAVVANSSTSIPSATPADTPLAVPSPTAPAPIAASGSFPPATQELGGLKFAETDLVISKLSGDRKLVFSVPAVEAERIALVTNLSWSENVPDGMKVARVSLRAEDGRVFDFDLRAGANTADWAYDRADISARVRHKRATVATSYAIEDTQGKYEGHTYVTSFALPKRLWSQAARWSLKNRRAGLIFNSASSASRSSATMATRTLCAESGWRK